MKKATTLPKVVFAILLAWLRLFACGSNATASNHYTAKQLDAFASRVGQVFWVQTIDGKGPSFVTAPSPGAKSLQIDKVESFQITELVGQGEMNPYYKIRLESGQEVYITPDQFLFRLNVTILTADPSADEKRKIAKAAQENKKRVDWIQSQPWSPAVKEAAIKKQATLGLNTIEVKRVLGQPSRVSRIHGPIKVAEEHWFYPDGSVLIFYNGLLSKIERREKK